MANANTLIVLRLSSRFVKKASGCWTRSSIRFVLNKRCRIYYCCSEFPPNELFMCLTLNQECCNNKRKKNLKLSHIRIYYDWSSSHCTSVEYNSDTRGFVDQNKSQMCPTVWKMLLLKTHYARCWSLCRHEVISCSRYTLNRFSCIISLVKLVKGKCERFLHAVRLKLWKWFALSKQKKWSQ